jgi:hypothetical protein
VQFPAHNALEVERYLAAIREAGLHAEDIEIRKADLEDVFLDVMAGGRMQRQCCAQAKGHIMSGWQTLFYKEVLRFWKVSFQTVAAPVLTAVLYMLIFGHVLEDHVKVYGQVSYTAFLVPGLVMMSVLQNAFANSSSSLVQSKIMGSLVFLLLTPLSHWSWFFAYVGSSVVRGLLVGAGVLIATTFFATPVFCGAVVDRGVRRARGGHAGRAGSDCRLVGGQVRPDGGVPEFHHHADDLSLRRVLFHPFAAGLLAGRQPPESVFLHD